MAEKPRAYHAGYTISGVPAETVFVALLDVKSFPEWALGLDSVTTKDPKGHETSEVKPGTMLEFRLRAAGFTHTIASQIQSVEPPHLLKWRYLQGATGTGAWYVEQPTPTTVRLTLSTDYDVKPAWLNTLAHRPFFRNITRDLLKRSIRRFEKKLRQKPKANS